MPQYNYEESIEVEAPIRAVRHQWTQYKKFPEFMNGVESVELLGSDKVHWKVKIGDVTKEFDTTILSEKHENKIVWTSENGPSHSGTVEFEEISDNKTKVFLQMDFDPEGFLENVADKLGLISTAIKNNLNNFRQLMETLPPKSYKS